MQMQIEGRKEGKRELEERELATLIKVVQQMKTTLKGINNFATKQRLLRSIATTEKKIAHLQAVLELESKLSATTLAEQPDTRLNQGK